VDSYLKLEVVRVVIRVMVKQAQDMEVQEEVFLGKRLLQRYALPLSDQPATATGSS